MSSNQLAADIRTILPGQDCAGRGGCGFPTCAQCAAAIADGAPANRCPACSQEEVDAILALTGGEPVLAKDEKAFLQCAGQAAGKARLKGAPSCQAAVESGLRPEECAYGCVGAGSCVEACTFGALSVEDGNVTVDRDKCNGCGACVSACVQHLFRMVPAKATNFVPCANQDEEDRAIRLCGYSCIGCGDCVEACPEGAVSVVDNRAVIDYEKCVGCVACTVSCRKKIIVDTYHDLTKVKPKIGRAHV